MRRNHSLKTIQMTYRFINSGNFTTMQIRNLHDVIFEKLFVAQSHKNIPIHKYLY